LVRWEVSGDVRAWDLDTGELRHSWKHDPPRGVIGMVLSPDGSTAATFEALSGESDKSEPARATSRCEPVYEGIRQSVGQSGWVVPDETGWRVGRRPAWLHALVGPEATAYVIDPTRGGAVAEAILGPDYDGTMIHDGWSPYDQFENAHHQQCLNLDFPDDSVVSAWRLRPSSGCALTGRY